MTNRLLAFAALMLLSLGLRAQAIWQDNVAEKFIPNTENSEVLRYLYGNYDDEGKFSRILRPSAALVKNFAKRPEAKDSIIAKALSVNTTKGDTPMVFVLSSLDFPGDTCNDCAPVLEMATFRFRDSLWEFKSRKLIGMFHGGEDEQFGFVELGKSHYGYILRNVLPGYLIKQEELILWGDYKDELHPLMKLSPSKENNKEICGDGDLPCYKYRATMKVKRDSDYEYYPIEVKYKGKRLTWNNELVKKKEKQTWLFKNGGYESPAKKN